MAYASTARASKACCIACMPCSIMESMVAAAHGKKVGDPHHFGRTVGARYGLRPTVVVGQRSADSGPHDAMFALVDGYDQLAQDHGVAERHDASVRFETRVGHEPGNQPRVKRANVRQRIPDIG